MSNLSIYLNNGQNTIPVPGSIIAYLSRSPPNGWILCDGQQLQYDSFPELGANLGGTANGSFNVPNLSGVFLRGQGNQTYQGKTYASATLKDFQLDTYIGHKHQITYDTDNPGGNGGNLYAIGTGFDDLTTSFGGSETRPYSYGVFWIIKTDILPNVPGKPRITSHVGTPGGGTLSITFQPPTINSSQIIRYDYSTDFGKTWSNTGTTSPFSIPRGSYSSVRLRAANSNGPGESSDIYYNLGLKFTIYDGYFNDNVNYFATAPKIALQGTTGGATLGIQQLQVGTNDLINSLSDKNTFSIQWFGNFRANETGNWYFTTESDDASFVWIGDNAYSNYSVSNATVNNGGKHSTRARTSGPVALTEGVYYPIRIQYGDDDGGEVMTFYFTNPSGDTIYAGDGYFFSPFAEQKFSNAE